MAKDIFNRTWITEQAVEIVQRYSDGELTLRGLHYQLVAVGMTNTQRHYKRVISAMIKARWEGVISFEAFSDHDREVIGDTDIEVKTLEGEIELAKSSIDDWMNYYSKNKWSNQPIIPEVWIEKKALQGVFGKPCLRKRVALAPCKGYPSLTFLNDAKKRFENVQDEGKTPIILYFGDYDASGEDIPRSIHENLRDMGVDIEVRRISLLHEQVVEWNLPHAPTKTTDSRAKNWDGVGQVELDAVDPSKLREMAKEAIEDCFDEDLYRILIEETEKETEEYRTTLKAYVKDLE